MNVKSMLNASDARLISSRGVPIGTSRSDAKITSAGFAVIDEFASNEPSKIWVDVSVASVLALSSGEGGYGDESLSSAETGVELGAFVLTSACNAARGLALRLFPMGTMGVIRAARIMLPVRSAFIVSPPSRRWAPQNI